MLRAQVVAILLVLLVLRLYAAEEGPDIHFWIVENTRLEDGRHRTSALFLYHRTTNSDGSLYSSHYLNYVSAPGFTAVLPLWYRIGEPGATHSMLVPLWFQGPGYGVAPLALSGGWTRADGGSSLWITPLFHLDRDKSGQVEDAHLLTWLQGDGYQALLPLYYRIGEHAGVVPAWFSGPGWWAVPPALSASWTRDDGGRSTWVTPLFHLGRDAGGQVDGTHLGPWFHGPGRDALIPLYATWRNEAGGRTTWITPLFHRSSDAEGETTSFHVLNWLHDQNSDIILPLAWLDHRDGRTTGVVLPLWAGGRDWWVAPPLLSAAWRGADGSTTRWLTPLYHRSVSGDGKQVDRHLLTWLSGEDDGADPSAYQLLFPLYYHDRRSVDGVVSSHTAVFPLWLDGPGYDVIPPLMSARWRSGDGSTTTWITPLFHRTADADGRLRSQHAGLWWQDRDAAGAERQTLFPLWWRWTADGGGNALLPLWYHDPDLTVVPPLLSWHRRLPDGGSSTWITPLFHRDRNAAGDVTSLHVLNWIRSGETSMLLPLYYRSGDDLGILPLYLANAHGWTAPPLLSWHRRFDDGSDTTWITPLAHVSHEADGGIGSQHVLNWFQGRDWQVLFPLAYRSGPPGQRHQGIIPLVFAGPNGWVAPPALSGSWRRDGGGRSTWITPLFHLDRDADGQVENLHAGPWFQGRDWQVLFPLAYRSGPPGQRQQGLVPLAFSGPDWWAVPPLLSGGWRRDDGGSTTWITPLFHLGRDREGRVDGMHALTWVSGRSGSGSSSSSGLLPLWWRSSTATVVPPLLSARWRRDDGGHSTWITPLFHVDSDAAGETTDWHALNVFHGGDTTVVAPLAWFSGPPEARTRVVLPFFWQGPRHTAVVPLWFSGPDWWTVPLGLSAGWRDGARSTALITPFYHRTSEDAQTRHMHLLNWISTPELSALAPLYWNWRTAAGGRRTVIAPLWYQHTGPDGAFTATVMPLLASYHRGAELDTSFGYQLFPFLMQRANDGHEVNVLWRLFHLREQHGSTEVQVWPLWWSEHRDGEPMSWQVLGGLVGRDCDREQHTSLSYAVWGAWRFGHRTAYENP